MSNQLFDITAPQQAEKALWETEELFRQVVSSIAAHIYVSKINPDGDHINLYLSPNVEALTGYPLESFMADASFWASMVIHPDDRLLATDQLERLKLNQDSETEYRLVKANGETIWVRDSSKVQITDNCQVIYGVVSDITERKQAEMALLKERALLAQRVAERTADLSRANAELARVNRLKDEFLASMSHELRTPLNVILGMSEVLRTNTYGPLNPDQLSALDYVAESGYHLLDLINDILDFSKIEAGKLYVEITSVRVQEVYQASLRLVKQMAREKGIKLHTTVDSNVITLPADERRLKQILINLLTNAVKFTPDGGQIGLEITGDPILDVVHFTVWDTGIGIAPENIEYLFQPFVQLDSKLSRQYEGTGLGLALVARLAEMHGGGVSVESELGRGSRFTVSLPWSTSANSTGAPAETACVSKPAPLQATEARLNPAAPAEVKGDQPLILIAEDNEANIATLSGFLRAKGCQILVARNGVEVLEQAKGELPAIILMDMQMPVMGGLETIAQIRRDVSPVMAALPVIALTALAMPGDQEKCLNAGANAYLSKPVSLVRLWELIQSLLAR